MDIDVFFTDCTLTEVREGSVGILSPHGALRAYTVSLTAVARRGSLRANCICNFHRPSPSKVRILLYILFYKIIGKCENLPEKLTDYVKNILEKLADYVKIIG